MPHLTPDHKRHVTFYDEVHIIAPNTGPATPSEDSVNAAAYSAEYVERFLAEWGGYGMGLWLIDQLQTKVAPGVTKNTRNKMIHGLPDAEERDLAGDSLLLGATDRDAIARQRAGEAFFSPIGAFRAHRVKAVNLFDDYNYPHTPPPNDDELLSVIGTEPWFIEMAAIRLIAEMDIVMEQMNHLLAEQRKIVSSINDLRERLRNYLKLPVDAMEKRVRAVQAEVQLLREKLDSLHQRFRVTFYEGFIDERVPRALDPDVLAQRNLIIALHTSEIAVPAEILRKMMELIIEGCKQMLSRRVTT